MSLMKNRYHISVLLLTALCWLCLQVANAQLKIEVVKASNVARPIGLINPDGGLLQVMGVVQRDLQGSGRFLPKVSGGLPEQIDSVVAVNPDAWRAAGLNFVAIIKLNGNTLQVEIGDAFNKEVLATRNYNYNSNERAERRLSHQVADYIYETILGVKGAFDTRVAYVSRKGRSFSLIVADSDGAYPQTILNSNEPILSPSWSPDAKYLAYASMEGKQNQIVVHDLYSGNRHVVVRMPGINSAPSWSPDGNQLAFTLSKDGNPEIYVANRNGDNLRRLTNHAGIDTEPAWGKDGMIYFTSDRGGTPQIYKMSANGGTPVRVTNTGNYNANAAISKDGRLLAVMQRVDGRGFGIAVINLQSGEMKRLTNGGKDESPSFSGNGHMIIYSDGRGQLKAISNDGSIEQRFQGVGPDIRKPAWSPILD